MTTTATLDAAGRRRSPATYPDYLAGRSPRNKGRCYPADPPRVEEIMAVMREAGERPPGLRLRGLIVVLWRAGLRISEALALAEGDLEPSRGAMLVRRGKGGRRREVGMDEWGWRQLGPWLEHRAGLPLGPASFASKAVVPGPGSAPCLELVARESRSADVRGEKQILSARPWSRFSADDRRPQRAAGPRDTFGR
jgi:integrase